MLRLRCVDERRGLPIGLPSLVDGKGGEGSLGIGIGNQHDRGLEAADEIWLLGCAAVADFLGPEAERAPCGGKLPAQAPRLRTNGVAPPS